MKDWKHIIWIIGGIIVSFLASFIFGDLMTLPLNLYYLIYFVIIITFFAIYIKKTQLDVNSIFKKRLLWGILLGLLFSFVMIKNVLSRPETEKLTGAVLIWGIFWRGLVYGTIDGLLLTVFPWIVTWRAFRAEEKSIGKKIAIGLVAWIFIIVTTSAYHSGYSDFRSKKMIQANIGNTIMSIPTLVSANPVATPIAHAALHVAAVIHSPETKLFLPPHREQNNRPKIEVNDISVEQLKKMMENKNFTLINVHIPYEGELPGTDLLIPFNEIEKNQDKLPANKNAKIVLYCLSDRMSGIAAKKLIDMGYAMIYDVKGGMKAWQTASYELLDESGEK